MTTVFSLICLFLHCESGHGTAYTSLCASSGDAGGRKPALHASSWAYKIHRLLWQGDSAHRELASLPFEENFPGGSVHVTFKPVHHAQAEKPAVLKEVFSGRREERESIRKVHGTDEG